MALALRVVSHSEIGLVRKNNQDSGYTSPHLLVVADGMGGAAAGGAAGHLAQKDSQPANQASFGALFDDALAHDGEPQVAPTPEQNAMAGLMLRAMIQAAKSDGHVDDTERQRLLGHLGDDLDDDVPF